MHANPFAILISSTDDGPFATHLPVFVQANPASTSSIRGHVAKANPHWRHLEQQSGMPDDFPRPPCLRLRLELHRSRKCSYVELRRVHAYGNARVFVSPEELQGVLHDLIGTFEPAYAEQWSSLADAYRERMLSHIVGFEISVTKLEAKFKLSQNRTKEEQSNVIASLGKADDTAISGVSRLMRQQGLGVKKEQE